MIKIRIFIKNETEWELVQNILFLLGYRWAGNSITNPNKIYAFDTINRYISVFNDGVMRYGLSPNFYTEVKDIKFEEFLDYIEQNEIKYTN